MWRKDWEKPRFSDVFQVSWILLCCTLTTSEISNSPLPLFSNSRHTTVQVWPSDNSARGGCGGGPFTRVRGSESAHRFLSATKHPLLRDLHSPRKDQKRTSPVTTALVRTSKITVATIPKWGCIRGIRLAQSRCAATPSKDASRVWATASLTLMTMLFH